MPIPIGFVSSILLPTVKDKYKYEGLNNITNNRPINILLVIAKVIEHCTKKFSNKNLVCHTNKLDLFAMKKCDSCIQQDS